MGQSYKQYYDIIGRDKTGPATKAAVGNIGAIKAASASLAATMAPLAAAAAVGGLAAMIKSQIDGADAIQKMSLQLQVSTEALSQYRHVAKLTGTSFESVTKGIRYMQKNMSDAEDGLSTAKRAFSDLGLEVAGLRRLAPEEAFELIGQRLSEIEDPAKRTQLAMNVFGRAGAELNQTFAAGAESVREMREEADRLGLTMSKDMADSAAEANDAVTRLNASFDGLKQKIAGLAAPEMAKGFDWINERIEEMQGARDAAQFNDRVTQRMDFLIDSGGADQFRGKWTKSLDLKALRDYAEGLVALELDMERQAVAATKQAAAAAVVNTSLAEMAPLVAAAAAPIKDLTSAFAINEAHLQDGLFGPQMLADIDAYVNGLDAVEQAGSQSMTIMADAAYDASRRMADSIAAAVFESEDLLGGLGNIAKSVFGSILSSFISIGVSSILPVPGIGGAAASVASGGSFIGPVKSAGAALGKSTGGAVSVGNLNVSVAGTVSNDPITVRRLAEEIYTEIQQVAVQHG